MKDAVIILCGGGPAPGMNPPMECMGLRSPIWMKKT